MKFGKGLAIHGKRFVLAQFYAIPLKILTRKTKKTQISYQILIIHTDAKKHFRDCAVPLNNNSALPPAA